MDGHYGGDLSKEPLAEYQNIVFETKGHVAYITLNRPEKLNALSRALQNEMWDALHSIEADENLRVVVIRANGRAFCAGYDTTPEPGRPVDPYPSMRKDIEGMRKTSQRWGDLWNFSKPVIAQVHGYCLAGGTDLILHCDFIIAAEDAQIGVPPVRAMGTPPTHMWTYRVGPQWAKYMLLTGNSIDGKTAERIGLAWKAVPADKLQETVDELAGTMAKITWDMLAGNKSIVNKTIEAMGRTLIQQLAVENDSILHQSPAVKEFNRILKEEGLKAALEWRDGPFRDYRGRAKQ